MYVSSRIARLYGRLLVLIAIGMAVSLGHAMATSPLIPPDGLTAPGQLTPMPAFDLPDVNGTTLGAADLQGKVTVVRFWATW